MYCNKCGKEVPKQAKFCNYCGNPLQEIATNKKSKTDSADKNTFMFMQLATVGLVVAFLWLLFQPVAWIEPCTQTDYKKANMNIIDYSKEMVIGEYSFTDRYKVFDDWYEKKIKAYDVFSYMDARNKWNIQKGEEVRYQESLVMLSCLTYYGAMIFLIIEILIIICFAYRLIKNQEYSLSFLKELFILEMGRAILLFWHISSLGDDMLNVWHELDFYPYYYIYVKTILVIILLFVLHAVYFKNRKVVENKD